MSHSHALPSEEFVRYAKRKTPNPGREWGKALVCSALATGCAAFSTAVQVFNFCNFPNSFTGGAIAGQIALANSAKNDFVYALRVFAHNGRTEDDKEPAFTAQQSVSHSFKLLARSFGVDALINLAAPYYAECGTEQFFQDCKIAGAQDLITAGLFQTASTFKPKAP